MAVRFQDRFLGAPKLQKGALLFALGQALQPVGFLRMKKTPGKFQRIRAWAWIFQVAANGQIFAADQQKLLAAMAPTDIVIVQWRGQAWPSPFIAV